MFADASRSLGTGNIKKIMLGLIQTIFVNIEVTREILNNSKLISLVASGPNGL